MSKIQEAVNAATPEKPIDLESIKQAIEVLAREQKKGGETKEVILDGRSGAYRVEHNGVAVPGFNITFTDKDRGLSELVRALKWAGIREQDKIAQEGRRFTAMADKIAQARAAAEQAIVAQYMRGLPR